MAGSSPPISSGRIKASTRFWRNSFQSSPTWSANRPSQACFSSADHCSRHTISQTREDAASHSAAVRGAARFQPTDPSRLHLPETQAFQSRYRQATSNTGRRSTTWYVETYSITGTPRRLKTGYPIALEIVGPVVDGDGHGSRRKRSLAHTWQVLRERKNRIPLGGQTRASTGVTLSDKQRWIPEMLVIQRETVVAQDQQPPGPPPAAACQGQPASPADDIKRRVPHPSSHRLAHP